MMKALWGLIQLLFFALLLALVFHNYLARKGLDFYLQSSLGMPVEIESAQVDLLGSKIFFRNILIHNPPDFPEGLMVKIPYLSMDLNPKAFSDGKVRFEKIEVDVGDFKILRLPDSRVNWRHLKMIRDAREEGPGMPRGKPRIQIAHFILTLRQGTYRDLTQGGKGKNYVFDVDRQDYLNVHTLKDMVYIISWEAFKRMGLERLSDGVLDQIREDLEGGH